MNKKRQSTDTNIQGDLDVEIIWHVFKANKCLKYKKRLQKAITNSLETNKKHSLIKETEDIKKKQIEILKLKNTIMKILNSMDWLKSRGKSQWT